MVKWCTACPLHCPGSRQLSLRPTLLSTAKNDAAQVLTYGGTSARGATRHCTAQLQRVQQTSCDCCLQQALARHPGTAAGVWHETTLLVSRMMMRTMRRGEEVGGTTCPAMMPLIQEHHMPHMYTLIRA